MLKPEDVTLCTACDKVVARSQRNTMVNLHVDNRDCANAKTLAEYVREYGQEQRGLGYEEGHEAARVEAE